LRKTGIILYCLILVQFSIHAQHSKYVRVFHEYYDQKPIHFGFLFGLASTNFSINADRAKLGADSVVRSPRTFGFQIGGLVNYAFSKHFELKTGLNIALYERQILFSLAPTKPDLNPLIRESTWLEIPLLIKYKSLRRDNHRMYFIGGVKMAIEANVKKKSSALSANTSDISLEYGFGLEHFFQYFKFTPEIRFSHGLTNLYVQPTTSINSFSNMNYLKSHTVSLIINFE
jgi:hypothetical protein